MHRKRSALSQIEVAYLLGTQSAAKVCRYERFVREPGLQTALAYEVVFGVPVSVLFAGLFEQTERDVTSRARALEKTQQFTTTRRLTLLKRATIAKICNKRPLHMAPKP